MADLVNDQKKKTAGGDLRLGSTSNPPDALPSVEAPVPVDLPAKQSAPAIPIPVPPPDNQQASKVSSSPPSITVPPARQPSLAVHPDPAETAAIREAANDPLPGDAVPPPVETTFGSTDATFPVVRGTGEQYNRPQEMTAEQAASAYLQPDANKAVAAQQLERAISNEAINNLGPDDFIPYMINQPGLRNLIAESAQQRQSIFAQYANENKQNADYAAALTAQVEADRQAKNSSTSDGLEWVRTIIGQRDGVRQYNAPVQFNQQTKEYDMNLLGAILYPLGVIQNTVLGAALDGRQLIRQLGNVIPPQHRGFADRFMRQTPLFKKLGIAQWVLDGNKYDDGKSNIIEAIRGAQYSFSDDVGEGVGIGIQAGAFKTPKLPIVGEVGVNPSKLLGFAGDVFVGVKLDKVVKAAAKRLGIGARAVAPPTTSAPKRPQLPPSPQRAALPPARSPIQAPGGAVKQRPRQLPPASQQVVVLPPPRRAYTPQPRLPATAPRKLLMPSRVAELRTPLNATPKEKLQLLKPLVAKPVQDLRKDVAKFVDEVEQLFEQAGSVGKKYEFTAAPLDVKVYGVSTYLEKVLASKPEKLGQLLSKPKNPVVQLIKEQLQQLEWWRSATGKEFAQQLDDVLNTSPTKIEEALTKNGVDVEQLRQVIDDIVPPQDATDIISETLQQLPKVGDEVTDALNESLMTQQLREGIIAKADDVALQQGDTLDIGRREVDDELLPDVTPIADDVPAVPTSIVDDITEETAPVAASVDEIAPMPTTLEERLAKLAVNKSDYGSVTPQDLLTEFTQKEVDELIGSGIIDRTNAGGRHAITALDSDVGNIANYAVTSITKFFKPSQKASDSILRAIAANPDNLLDVSQLAKTTGLSKGDIWSNVFKLSRANKVDVNTLQEADSYTADAVRFGLEQNIGGPAFFVSKGEDFVAPTGQAAKAVTPSPPATVKAKAKPAAVEAPTPPNILPLKRISATKAYHGTRVQNLDLAAVDPVLGSARNELGTGIYTYGSKAKAAYPAKSDAAINLPDVPGREFGDGVIHELQLTGNVLDGKAQIPALKGMAFKAAGDSAELRAVIDNAYDVSIVGLLDDVSANATEEGALAFQRQFMQVLRANDVQHIRAGGITSTIDPAGIITQGVTAVKGATTDISPEVMLRNRLKMELDAVQQTGSQFMKATAADTLNRASAQAVDSAEQLAEAAQLKTYDAVKRSGLLDDVVPQSRDLSVTPPSQATSRADDVISRYVETAKRSSDDYITGLIEGRVPAKRGENFTALVRDVLDGHVDDPKLISLLEGKYVKLYDSVADKIYNESYSKLLPSSVKQVSTAIDDVMAEISTHPPDSVPPELQSKLDDLLDQIDDEAFDRKFSDALKSDAPPAKNTDNPSSPCDI